MFWGMFAPPPDPRTVIAKDAHEVSVPAAELGVAGTVLVDETRAVVALDVPSGTQREVLRLTGDETVFAVAGPNNHGVAAVAVNNMMAKRHRLVRIDVATGQSKTIFERDGDALWESAIGSNIAIARDSDVAVIFVGKDNVQLSDPPAYMSRGEIQTVDLSTGKTKTVAKDGLEDPMAISADGQRVWYVAEYARKKARQLPGGEQLTDSGSPASTVFVYHDGQSQAVAPGWGATLSDNEETLVLSGNWTPASILDLTTKKVGWSPLQKHMGSIHWLSGKGVFVATAQPIRAEDVEFTKNNGMPGPRPLLRIVAVQPGDDKVALLWKGIDPRKRWSFGTWRAKP